MRRREEERCSLRINKLLDLLERPLDQRVNLDKSRRVNLDDGESSAFRPLRPTTTCQDGADPELGVSAVGGFDLTRTTDTKQDEEAVSSEKPKVKQERNASINPP